MAFSDLCHIGKAYKTVENETDQSERIMEENSIVRDLITKILDETGPAEGSSSIQSPEKAVSGLQSTYPKNDTINTSYIPPSYNTYQNNLYSFPQNDQNGFNSFNIQNGFGNTNGFVNYPDSDVSALLGIEPVADTSTDTVTPEQLNLLRLAAQEIGGAQFATPNNKFDDKYYNFFEPNQRNSLPETSMFSVTNFNRPNSLNLDMNYNSNYDYTAQRYANNFKDQNQDPSEILSYLSQLNLSRDRVRDENPVNSIDFKMPMDLNGHYTSEFGKTNSEEQNKMFYGRNYQQLTGNKNFAENNYYDIVSQINDRSPISQSYDFANQNQPPVTNSGGAYKSNGYQNEFMPRRDMNQIVTSRDNYQPNGEQRTNFDNMQQAALIRQNQELARQMNLLMRNRPPPSQLNVDVSFLHENTPFSIGPSTTVPPPVLPSPMLDLPLLAPFYAMRNMRGAATSSSILHGRLDACYEQWRQLERERKRTEARLALAYPGRAVSSSNSIPVPRLPPCPTRVDRLTVDMLREHTKVLTLMGKMETLRASVCVVQNKKPNKPEDAKITVLKRGQENVPNEKDGGLDPNTFDPSTWREDLKNLSEIAPHSEVESAMLSWRSAVGGVQAARRRELAPHHQHPHAARYPRNDPILQLADAVKQLSISARRARCAMWCDLTLTVALAPDHHHHHHHQHQPTATTVTNAVTNAATAVTTPTTTLADICPNENAQQSSQPATPTKQLAQDKTSQTSTSKTNTVENKEEKPAANETKTDTKTDTTSKTTNKQTDKQDKSRRNQYRKLNQGRNDFYQKNQRYDARFMHNRPPYHYLATGPIN